MENNLILEDTSSIDIASQEKLLGAIDRLLVKRSICRRCSDVQPMTGPVGVVTGSSWDKVNKKLEVKKAEIQAVTDKIMTEFTQEALDDLKGIYGEDLYELIAHYVIDEVVYAIDSRYITMIKDRAKNTGTLTFSAAEYDKFLESAGKSIVIKVIKGLADLPLTDNKSPGGFCIVSPAVAAIITMSTQLSDNIKSEIDTGDESPSYLGNLAHIDFYVDYTYNGITDNVVFGLKGNGFSKGSTIYCPYLRKWYEYRDPSTGEINYFITNRGTAVINPLDDGVESTYLGKFSVDLTDLSVFK